MSTREALARALAGVVSRGDFKVPPYPAVALRLQRMLSSDRYSLGDVTNVIATDAALAATVLAAANTAVVGVVPPVTNLSRAVAKLGARAVAAIALASGVGAASVSTGVLLDVKFRIWRRTMSCALVCQRLAPGRGLAPEQAFLAGLLHGFGRSIAVAAIEQLLRQERSPTPRSAEEWLGIAEEQRASLARAVSRSWQLPTAIADAIDDKERGASALNDLVIDAEAIVAKVETAMVPVAPRSDETESLNDLLAGLPAALNAFSCAAGAASKLVTSASGALIKPDHALIGELRRTTLAVADRGSKCPSTLRCLALAPAGLEVESSRRYQECAVVRLAIGDGEPVLEPWFTVVLCVPEGSRHRVELQLFSPTSGVREQWLALYGAAESDSKTSTVQPVAARAESEELAVAGSRTGV